MSASPYRPRLPVKLNRLLLELCCVPWRWGSHACLQSSVARIMRNGNRLVDGNGADSGLRRELLHDGARHALGGGVALLPPGHGRLQSAAGHAVVIVAWPAQGAGDDRPRRSCSLLENLRRQSYKLELSGGKTGIGNRRNVIRDTTARFYSVDHIGTTVQRLTEQASRRGGGLKRKRPPP